MKKSLKFGLLFFVTFSLIFSIISIKEAKAVQVRECTSSFPYVESIPIYVSHCSCHGEGIDLNRCDFSWMSGLNCYQTFCEVQ